MYCDIYAQAGYLSQLFTRQRLQEIGMAEREEMIEKGSVRQWLEELSKQGGEGKNAGLRRRLYALASKPRRKRIVVNLAKIGKNAKEGENIIVPGKVLGGGSIGKGVNIAAVEYSEGAASKIEKAGGKVVRLDEMLTRQGVRIII